MFGRIIAELKVGLRALVHGRRKPLSAVVRRLHRTHMRLNPAARSLRLGWARRTLAGVERHPIGYLIGVAGLYGLVCGLTWAAPPIAWGPTEPVSDYFRDLQTVNLALFGAQATFLGLVYPLVIALVSILFGARSTSDRRLDVYFMQTGALPVGGLALALVGTIALQALSYGQLPPKVVGAITVLNCLWFVLNLLALGFFVVRSLDFIRPARKLTLTKSYLANVAFRDQLQILMAHNQWQQAPTYGLLPRPAAGATFVAGLSFAEPMMTRRLRGERVLKDIRLGLLYAVLVGRDETAPVLEFPLLPDAVYADKATLVSGDVDKLLWTERVLIRMAFRFGRPPRIDAPPTGEDILGEATADLVSLLGAGRFDEFHARLDEVLAQHVLLYRLAQEPEQVGRFNYAADGDGFRSVARAWVRAYRPLMMRAGETLDLDGRFYEACAYLPGSLVRDTRDLPFEVTAILLELSMTLFMATITGAARRHREAATAPPLAGHTYDVTGPGSAFYRRNWISLVAGWERVGVALIRLPKAETRDWARLRTVVPGLGDHLRMSALMVGHAAQLEESQAIGWTTDQLLKWRDRTRQTLDLPDGGFALRRPVVTMALASRPWDEVAPLPLSAFGEAIEPGEVFGVAIGNLWRDTLMVVATTLMEAFGPAGPEGRMHTGAAEAAGRLFRNESFDPGAAGHPHTLPLDLRGVLESILRIAGAGERFEEGYAGDLSSLAETITRLEGPNYVSARVYSWTGMAGFEDQAHAQVLLLAAAVGLPGRRHTAPGLSDDLKALLLPRDDRSKRRIQAHLKAMVDAAATIDTDHGRAVIATLRDQDVDAAELSERVADAIALLEQCVLEIQTVRQAEVVAAPIDPARLATFADQAAALAFARETGGFPLAIFQSVATDGAPLSRREVSTKARKGTFTDPLMADDGDALGEFVGRHLASLVSQLLVWDATQSRPPTERRPTSALAYWTALKAAIADIQAAGQTPIIVRPDRNQPQWLSHWHFPPSGIPERPADMTLERRDSVDDGYDFHLNGVPVYSNVGAAGATWVFGQEILRTATFQRFADGRLVEVAFVEDPTDPWEGRLLTAFARDVETGDGPLWRLNHPVPKAPSPPAATKAKAGPKPKAKAKIRSKAKAGVRPRRGSAAS